MATGERGGVRRKEPSERARRFREQLIPSDSYNLVDVAHILGIDESSVRRYIRAGDLVAFNLGREYMVAERDLRAYIEGQQARQREKQRVMGIRREVIGIFNRVKNTPAANELTLAICRECGHETILKYWEYSGEFEYGWETHAGWSGTCKFCNSEQKLDYGSSPSIADRVAGKTEATPNPDDDLENIPDGDITDDLASMDEIPF
jgi:hypothetical protein